MLHKIGSPRTGGDEPRGVVPRLLDCHERIRRFTALAVKLGGADEAPADEVRQAASMTLGYFVRSLPHHSADEDESIAPALAGAGVDAALATMTEQHRALEAILARLEPLWQQLVDDPSRRAALRDDLARDGRELHALFEDHLVREESTIFPAIDALPEATQQRIVEQMIARRQPKA